MIPSSVLKPTARGNGPSKKHSQGVSSSSAFSSALSINARPFVSSVLKSMTVEEDNDFDDEREMEYYANAATELVSTSSISPIPRRPTTDGTSNGTAATTGSGTAGVRYVNIRVAIPVDGSSPMLPSQELSSASPMTMASHSTSSFSPLPASPRTTPFSQSTSPSPCGFVPIPPSSAALAYQEQYHYGALNTINSSKRGSEKPTRTPTASPYEQLTTSSWTVATETSLSETPVGSDTVETASTTRINPASMTGSVSAPPLYYLPRNPSYRRRASPSPIGLVKRSHHGRGESPRPRTPNSIGSNSGRKSPFGGSSASSHKSRSHASSRINLISGGSSINTCQFISGSGSLEEDDIVRKTRIKTEMCFHYANGRPCPYGADCTYAHGEEELQMTKLVDLHHAGLIDVESFRTRPCFTWIATGSW